MTWLRTLGREESGASTVELLVGGVIGALIMTAVTSTTLIAFDVHRTADDHNTLAAGFAVVSTHLDRDGSMALATAAARSQTAATSCSSEMDLGFAEGGASVRYRTVAAGQDGPLWLERLSGSGTRPIARRVEACSWQAASDAGGDVTLLVNLTLAGRNGAVATRTLRVAPRLFHAGSVTYHLHNNPTPPSAGTTQQANLPMDQTAPTAGTLYNYDTDRDASPGRLVSKGGAGAGETDLTKYQNWRSPALASALAISGSVTFDFWSAIKDFQSNKIGNVRVFLRSFNPATSTYTEIANGTFNAGNWQAGSTTWVRRSLAISVSAFTIPVGHRLEAKVLVGSTAGDDMWFAYDTTTYRTQLILP